MSDDNFSQEINSKKKRSGCFSCFIVLLISFLVLLFLGSVAVAKTGFVRIPVISKYFYKPVGPTRIVDLSPDEIETVNVQIEKKMEDEVKKILMQKIKESDFSFSKDGFNMDQIKIELDLLLTEKEVTALLRKGLGDQQDLPFSNLQVVILPEELEFFGQLQDPVKTITTLAVKPEIIEGKINLEIKRLEIGALKVPSFLINLIFKNILNNKMEQLNEQLLVGADLKEIILKDGQIGIRATVDSLKQ